MKRFILVASALLCLCAAPVFGQSVSSRITGTVKDSQDAVVPGVKVTVIDVGTGAAGSTAGCQPGQPSADTGPGQQHSRAGIDTCRHAAGVSDTSANDGGASA